MPVNDVAFGSERSLSERTVDCDSVSRVLNRLVRTVRQIEKWPETCVCEHHQSTVGETPELL